MDDRGIDEEEEIWASMYPHPTPPCPTPVFLLHSHCIFPTFTLFKDKCIVNSVSPLTRYVCCSSPSAAKGALTSAAH